MFIRTVLAALFLSLEPVYASTCLQLNDELINVIKRQQKSENLKMWIPALEFSAHTSFYPFGEKDNNFLVLALFSWPFKKSNKDNLVYELTRKLPLRCYEE